MTSSSSSESAAPMGRPLNPPLSPRTPPPPPLPSPPTRPQPAHLLPPPLQPTDEHDPLAAEPERNEIMSLTSVEAPILAHPQPSRPAASSLGTRPLDPLDPSVVANASDTLPKLKEVPARPESPASGGGSGTASGSQTLVASDNEMENGVEGSLGIPKTEIRGGKHIDEMVTGPGVGEEDVTSKVS